MASVKGQLRLSRPPLRGLIVVEHFMEIASFAHAG